VTPYLQVHTTVSRRDEADRLARSALTERLVACVQVTGPLRSLYHWQGALEEAEEYGIVFKTRQDLLPPLMDLLRREHSYELPEILATPVLDGSPAYLAWLETELRPPVTPAA